MAPSDLDWLSIIELDLELDPLKILAIAQLFVNWIRWPSLTLVSPS